MLPYLLNTATLTYLHLQVSLTRAVLVRIGFATFVSNHFVVEEQCGDLIRKVVKRDSKPPQREQPPRKLPAASCLSQAEAAAYASEFGAAPREPISEDEANVSPYEDDGAVIPRKRFKGLAGSSRDHRSVHLGARQKRTRDATLLRECAPRAKRPRELRPLRSDASVELGAVQAPIGQSLRSRLVATWLTNSHHRHMDDSALAHWRSGQADHEQLLSSSDSSEQSPRSALG